MAPVHGSDCKILTQALLDASDFPRRIVERTLQEVLEAEMTAHVGTSFSSTNGWEQLMQEIKRRTRVIRIFPNREARLRLVTALCAEQSDEWVTGMCHLNIGELRRRQQDQGGEKGSLLRE